MIVGQRQLRALQQARHLRTHSSLLSNLEANSSHHVRDNRMSSSEKHFANDQQRGQTLGHEILLRVRAKPVQWSTQARSRRPQVGYLPMKGEWMLWSQGCFSLLNNIWALTRLIAGGAIASFC